MVFGSDKTADMSNDFDVIPYREFRTDICPCCFREFEFVYVYGIIEYGKLFPSEDDFSGFFSACPQMSGIVFHHGRKYGKEKDCFVDSSFDKGGM